MRTTKLARHFARTMLFAGFAGLPFVAYAQNPVGTAAPAASMPVPAQSSLPSIGLIDLTQLALAQNPRLAQGALAVDAARGRAIQAGLYPNPTVSATFDELGDRTGPQGVNTLPLVTQEIVTGNKLKLSKAAAVSEIDQATHLLAAQRYTLLANVRFGYFDVVALQRRSEILQELVKTAESSIAQTDKLLAGGLVSSLDRVQLEVELERLRADLQATERELPAAHRKLAAIVGARDLSITQVAGTLDQSLPPYELESVQRCVLSAHPERQAALAGVERARRQLRREQVEPLPNVSVSGGYVRQNQNRSDDWTVGVSVPIPVWNRNQGRIATATAELGSAQQEVSRVENDLSERVATAYREFAAARQRADRYRLGILPKAQEAYQLSLNAYQGGQFEYLRVLEAQRAIATSNLEYVRALADAWKAASILSGLTLEEQWPPITVTNDSKAPVLQPPR